MKADNLTLETPKKLTRSVKAQAAKVRKTIRKSTSSAKKASRTAVKRTMRAQQSTLSGYGDNASRFIGRAKSALGDAYTWVGETGSALPKSARQIGLPNQQSIQAFIDEKPLIVGAVGLGLGVALGAMIPLSHSAAPAKRPAGKSPRRK